jgi:hypothetical protein
MLVVRRLLVAGWALPLRSTFICFLCFLCFICDISDMNHDRGQIRSLWRQKVPTIMLTQAWGVGLVFWGCSPVRVTVVPGQTSGNNSGVGGPRRVNVVGAVSGRLAGTAERFGGRAAVGRDLHGVPPALQGWLDLMLRASDLRHVHLRVQAQGLPAVRMGRRAPDCRIGIKPIRGGRGEVPRALGHGGPDRLLPSLGRSPRRPASFSWGDSLGLF